MHGKDLLRPSGTHILHQILNNIILLQHLRRPGTNNTTSSRHGISCYLALDTTTSTKQQHQEQEAQTAAKPAPPSCDV